MTSQTLNRVFGVLALVGALGISGCASGPKPMKTGKRGLFDRLSRGQPSDAGKRGRSPASVYASDVNAPSARSTDGDLDVLTERRIRQSTVDWRWPLEHVKVTSPFGLRSGEFHDGLDLQAPTGTAVYAAQSGVVAYSGQKIKGYGNLVVLKHSGGLSTIYAHNSKLLVKKGQKVKRGEKIALSGNTGKSTGPHLHFEVRKGLSPINPERLLRGPRALASK